MPAKSAEKKKEKKKGNRRTPLRNENAGAARVGTRKIFRPKNFLLATPGLFTRAYVRTYVKTVAFVDSSGKNCDTMMRRDAKASVSMDVWQKPSSRRANVAEPE